MLPERSCPAAWRVSGTARAVRDFLPRNGAPHGQFGVHQTELAFVNRQPTRPESPDSDSAQCADVPRGTVPRLMGMETEYAVIVADHQDLDSDDLPPAGMVYEQIVEAVRRTQPAAPGIHDRDQWFLASGPAITFESHPSLWHLPGGLIEIATPEVHTAQDVLECQHAIDQLVAHAAADSETGYDLRVLKNSSDALGHVYGCQENYQCEVARGLNLLLYRMAILVLIAMQLFSQLLSLPFLALFVSLGMWANRRSPPTDSEDREVGERPLPPRHIGLMTTVLRWLHLPMVIGLRGVCRHLAFRRQQRFLTAHLVSRVALCGGGHLDHDGRYVLSPKSVITDQLADMGGFNGERPIYVFGHWLSQLCAKSFFSPWAMASLLHRQQRLQIGLSDSNLSDAASLVKMGSVALILDMIDSGATEGLPRLKSPVTAAVELGQDWNLIRRVPTNRGEQSAVEIQRVYLAAARTYAETLEGERRRTAEHTLQHWRQLFELASAFRRDARDTQRAMGRIDWLTKRVLMDGLGKDATWAERKKIDLRFHELSPDGYYRQILLADPTLALVDPEAIETRRRSAPVGTRAIRRGAWIREFAADGSDARAEWSHGQSGKQIKPF